jgi:hypothetical protein
MKFGKALTVGATGMLKETLLTIAQQAEETWVISRQADTFVEKHSARRLSPLRIDYTDPVIFMTALRKSVLLDEVDIALLWMHDVGNKTCLTLLDQLSQKQVLIVHVVGSASHNPGKQIAKVRRKISFCDNSLYCPVVLGAMASGNGRRWLTHKEISASATKAINTGTAQMAGKPLSDFD